MILRNNTCVIDLNHGLISFPVRRHQAKEMLAVKLPSWQESCCDITKVPDTVMTMIDELSSTPEQSPLVERYNRVS